MIFDPFKTMGIAESILSTVEGLHPSANTP